MSYSEAMAKHYQDKANETVPDTERSDREDLARRRETIFMEEQILAKLHYHWDSSIKVWWSDDSESLPLLKDSEARAIANEILDFVVK